MHFKTILPQGQEIHRKIVIFESPCMTFYSLIYENECNKRIFACIINIVKEKVLSLQCPFSHCTFSTLWHQILHWKFLLHLCTSLYWLKKSLRFLKKVASIKRLNCVFQSLRQVLYQTQKATKKLCWSRETESKLKSDLFLFGVESIV